MKKIIIIAAALLAAVPSFAQSRAFKLGKFIEIQAAVLKELVPPSAKHVEPPRLEARHRFLRPCLRVFEQTCSSSS